MLAPVTSSANVRSRSVTAVPSSTAPPGVRYSVLRESWRRPSHSTLLSVPCPGGVSTVTDGVLVAESNAKWTVLPATTTVNGMLSGPPPAP